MSSKKKNLRRLIFWGIVIVFVYLGFGGDYNLYQLWKLNQKKQILHVKIQQSKQMQEQLSSEITKLKYDSTYIEKIAREEFKMGKQGEQIYLINTKDEK